MPARTSGARPFTAGAALSRTFSSWGGTLPPQLLLAIVVSAPMIAWRWFKRDEPADGGWDPVDLIDHLIDVVLSGMCIYVVFKRLVSEPARVGDAFSAALRRLVPLVLNGLLVVAVLAVPGVLVMLAAERGATWAIFMAIPLGVVANIVMTVVSASPGAIVVEGAGAIAAVKRSAALTSGSRWSIFWGYVLLGIVGSALVWVATFAGRAFESETSPASFIIFSFVGLLTTTLNATYAAVVYHDLRASKEGVDVRELMRVFA